ncbi:hypothetical protein BC832DRAFT_1833 [Gaertneriomyces semiglobifer]|nr:hypothetical protein BC832DRAFT_1833 [Gaertneriomyces semiglobifer]
MDLLIQQFLIEDGEIFVTNLVESIIQKSQDVLFEKHIESQVLPFAVADAREKIDSLIEWEFFRRDPGDLLPCTWELDVEPPPPLIDSWAPGALPIRKTVVHPVSPPPPAPLSESQSASTISIVDSIHEDERPKSATSIGNSASLMKSVGSVRGPSNRDLASAASLATSTTSTARRRMSHSGGSYGNQRRSLIPKEAVPSPLTASQIAEMAIQEENKRILNRLKSAEKDGARAEWSYDQDGRIVMVKKPKVVVANIKTKVLPPAATAPKPPPSDAHHIPWRLKRLKQPQSMAKSKSRSLGSRLTFDAGTAASTGEWAASGFTEDPTLEVPALVDTMRLSPGVLLREGDAVKRGPNANPIANASITSSAGSLHPSKLRSPQPPGAVPDPLTKVLAKARPVVRKYPFGGSTSTPLPNIPAAENEDQGQSTDMHIERHGVTV